MNQAIARDNYAVLDSVRAYLREVDLARCTTARIESDWGVPFATIRHRLDLVGTTWQAEKTAERHRRLLALTGQPGRLKVSVARDACGFLTNESFLLFFKQRMGQTFTQWRLARQRLQ